VLQARFTFTAHEITKAYQDSFGKTLEAIRNELAGKPSLFSSKLRHDFSAQFSAQIRSGGVDSEALSPFINQKAKLFQIDNLSETDLASLVNAQSTAALTDLLLEQMQLIAPISDKLMAFLRQDDLLGQAMLFFLREQFRTDERFEKTLMALQQEAILFNQQRMLQLMENLQLSSQVKASDEFTRHDTRTQRLIQQSVLNLKHLSSKTAEYTQLTLMVGSAISSTGDLDQSESLFSQVIENTPRDEEKALAYFNRFQVRLRRKAYDTALVDLQAAIDLNPQDYALHDVKTYPMLELLGTGGMGCVFLCQNNNPLIAHQKVVVKCFWETLKDAPEKVFKEAVAMREIAGDFVPEPLYAGYANPFKQERAFFVTEYIEGTIDGEGWLEKYGTMDLKTGWQVALSLAQGLQVAHDKGIFHLDLKPANVLLTDSPAAVPLKIIDFGLAKIAPSLQQEALTRQNQSGLTQFGQAVMGTLHYAPPEQQGETQYGEPKAYSDVFAFGATMYRFWTGLSPRRFSERNLPNVPALRELLFDCVEENPNQRPDSAGGVLKRFKRIVEAQRKIREDEKAWQKAREQDSKSAYEAYLKGNTLKKHAVAAKNRLKAIETEDFAPVEDDEFIVTEDSMPVNDEVEKTKRWLDDRDWEKACEQNTLSAYQAYLDGNTVKRHAVEAKERIKPLEMAAAKKADEIAWKKASEQNTESAYRTYLEGNTLIKKHAGEAQQALEECRDETAWQKACQEDTKAAFQRYLEGDTLKKHAGEIKPRLQAIEVDKKAWQNACQQDTRAAYQAYLDGNTLKKYAEKAREQIKAIKEREADEKAWENARQQDTDAAYQAYLEGNTLKKYAQEAKKQRRRFLSLSFFNPLHHLRLLWWILVMPQRFKAYRAICGDEELKRVCSWLVSTLVWLPLLMPILGLGLELLPHSSKAWSAETYLLLSAGVFVCWLLTGWLGSIESIAYGCDTGGAGCIAFVVVFVVVFVVAFVVAFVGFGVSMERAGLLFLWAICVTVGVTVGVGVTINKSGVAFGVVFGVAFGVVFGVAFGGVAGGIQHNVGKVVIGFIMSFVVGYVAFVVAKVVEESLKTGTWFARFLFLLLIAAHLFLIGYCFLGGWRLFA
jgi:serine/threonine protein kinase